MNQGPPIDVNLALQDNDDDENVLPQLVPPTLTPAMITELYNNLTNDKKDVLKIKYNTSHSINEFNDNLEDDLHKFSIIFFDQNGNRRETPIAGGKKRKSKKRKSNKKRKSKKSKSTKRR